MCVCVCVYVYVCVCMSVLSECVYIYIYSMCMAGSSEAQKGIKSPECVFTYECGYAQKPEGVEYSSTGVPGSCEPPNMEITPGSSRGAASALNCHTPSSPRFGFRGWCASVYSSQWRLSSLSSQYLRQYWIYVFPNEWFLKNQQIVVLSFTVQF